MEKKESCGSLPPLTPQKDGGRTVFPFALQIADIIVSTTDHLISKGIRWYTNSNISHVMVYVGDGKVIEAISDGVVQRQLSEALSSVTLAVAYRFKNLDNVKASCVVDFLQKQIGKRYDIVGIIGHGIRVPYIQDNTKFYCSELAATAFNKCGISLGTPNFQLPITAIRILSFSIEFIFNLIWPSLRNPQYFVELANSGKLSYIGHLVSGGHRSNINTVHKDSSKYTSKHLD